MNSKMSNHLLAVVLGLFTVVIVIGGFAALVNQKPFKNSIKLNAGWIISKKSIVISDCENSETRERLIYSRTIPHNAFANPNLRFNNHGRIAKIYINDRLVYSYGVEEFKTGKMVGSGYHWVSLPPECGGKSISMEFIETRANDHFTFSYPILGRGEDTISDFLLENFVNLIISLFLLSMGIAIVALGLVASVFSWEYWRFSVLGAISFLVGVWLFAYTGVIQIFSEDIVFNLWIEYASMYTTPLVILAFIVTIWKPDIKKAVNVPFYGLFLLYAMVFAITFFKNISYGLHLNSMLPVFQLIDLCIISQFAVMSIHYFISEEKIGQKNAVLLGVLSLEMIFFTIILSSYFFELDGIEALPSLFLVVSVFTFFVSMLMSIFFGVLTAEEIRMGNEYSKKLRATDLRTGLKNRMSFFSKFERLFSEGKKMTLIVFSVQGLKEINHELTYTEGDLLIKTFAELLQKVFISSGTIGKIGDSKFGVLLYNNDRQLSHYYIEQYEKKAVLVNSDLYSFYVVALWGMAYSDEAETSEEFFNLAHDRLKEKEEENGNQLVVKDMAKIDFESIEKVFRTL